MRLLVLTIDTEADCSSDWTGQQPESYRNIVELETKLLPVTEAFRAPCTLLLNDDVTVRREPSQVCERLRHKHDWELGTHLHGELVPPQQTASGPAGIKLTELQCGYTPELEFAKMAALTTHFSDRFGYAPRSFRAGRYGAGKNTFEICAEMGYLVDTSVVPGHRFCSQSGTADFRDNPSRPYVMNLTGGKLVEVPITVRPRQYRPRVTVSDRLTGERVALRPWFRRKWTGVVNRLYRPPWLRPSFESSRQMGLILQSAIEQQGDSANVVANMMFHSCEITAGASPYTQVEADVERFLKRIGDTLQLAGDLGFGFATLSDAARQILCHEGPVLSGRTA